MKRTDDKEQLVPDLDNDGKITNGPFEKFILIFIACVVLYLIFVILRSVAGVTFASVKLFNTVFISILMQAFPFMFIGVLVSSTLHVFVSDSFLIKIFPAKYGLGFITAMFAGIFFRCVNAP